MKQYMNEQYTNEQTKQYANEQTKQSKYREYKYANNLEMP